MTCNLVIECTSKRNLNVTPYCFQVDVYNNDKDKKLLKTYRYDTTGQNVKLTVSKGDVAKGEKVETVLTCENMDDLKKDNIVEIKYWPRAQASEGLLGYTEAFATWSMKFNGTGFDKV